MNRRELEALVVHILDLDQREAGGMLHADARLHLLPHRLGRGQGVIAIAHGEQQHGCFCRPDRTSGGRAPAWPVVAERR